ncbi:hypothetical protein D3C86_1673340 [compost metagenome]
MILDGFAPLFERSMNCKFTFASIFLNSDASFDLPIIYIAVCAGLQPSDAVVGVDFAKANLDESFSLGVSQIYIARGRAS